MVDILKRIIGRLMEQCAREVTDLDSDDFFYHAEGIRFLQAHIAKQLDN